MVLVSIGLLAAGIRFFYGYTVSLEFDDLMSTFNAAHYWENYYQGFYQLIAAEVHPPLFLVFLKGMLSLCDSSPVYVRLISIITGILTVFLTGRIARRIGLAPIYEYIAMLLVALSYNHLYLSIAVRDYMLSCFLILLSLNYYFDLMDGQACTLSKRLCFYVVTLGVIYTNYYGIFYVAGLAATPFIQAAWNKRYRLKLRQGCRRLKLASAAEFSLPLGGLLLYGYFVSITLNHRLESDSTLFYLEKCYWQGQNILSFLLNRLVAEISLFTPFAQEIKPLLEGPQSTLFYLLFGIIGIIGLTLTIWGIARQQQAMSPEKRMVYNIVPSIFFVILGCIVILSLLKKYPFGGQMRHQFILYPFLVILLTMTIAAIMENSAATQRLRKYLLIFVFGAIMGVGFKEIYLHPWSRNYSCGQALDAISTRVGPGDHLFVGRDDMIHIYGLYLGASIHKARLSRWGLYLPAQKITIFPGDQWRFDDLSKPGYMQAIADIFKKCQNVQTIKFWRIRHPSTISVPPEILKKEILKHSAELGIKAQWQKFARVDLIIFQRLS